MRTGSQEMVKRRGWMREELQGTEYERKVYMSNGGSKRQYIVWHHLCGISNMSQLNLSVQQKASQTESRLVIAKVGEGGVSRGKLYIGNG